MFQLNIFKWVSADIVFVSS